MLSLDGPETGGNSTPLEVYQQPSRAIFQEIPTLWNMSDGKFDGEESRNLFSFLKGHILSNENFIFRSNQRIEA
jgi:hypothetical protein